MSSGSLPDVTLVQKVFCLTQLVGTEAVFTCTQAAPEQSHGPGTLGDRVNVALFSTHQVEVLS